MRDFVYNFLLSLAILKSENLHFSLRCKGGFMQEKDIVSMEYFENPARFADLLNGFLFRGKQIIKPGQVKTREKFHREQKGRISGMCSAFCRMRKIKRNS